MKTKQYTGKDIVELSDRDHVRLRTQIYLGNTHETSYTIPLLDKPSLQLQQIEFVPAVYKAVGEIIDNCLDEFAHINIPNKQLIIECDSEKGIFTIKDNGRGIPLDQKENGVYTPQVALSRLRAGRNFKDEKEIGVIGMNGVGAACTNFCSEMFEVNIYRDNKHYNQLFENGTGKVSRPSIRKKVSTKTGTEITFKLDKSVFKNISLPTTLVRNRAIEIALCNPDIIVLFNGEKFKFKNGFEAFVKTTAQNQYYEFKISSDFVEGSFFVITNIGNSIDEQMFTWVNSSLLFDGGKCNTQFFNAFFDKTIEHLQPQAKKNKSEITRNDVRENLFVIANLKIKNPEYDSQSKTRLTGPDLRKEIIQVIDSQWKSFIRKNDGWLNSVLEKATVRHHLNENKKAIDEHQKQLHRRVPGLLDATSKIRSECQLLITEGDSAKSQICQARDPKTTAAFALRGKVNNVYGMTPAQLLKMEKLTDLLAAIGLTPGKKSVRSMLRYGKIVIATDADYDGSDIFTLLVNVFYQYWPELFDKNYEPFIHRLVAPNVVASKNGKRVHFTTRNDYEKVKEKYQGWTIEYMKGLGSMNKTDWEMILSGKTDTQIPIYDDGKMKQTLTLLFSDNADNRKEWLQKDE